MKHVLECTTKRIDARNKRAIGASLKINVIL